MFRKLLAFSSACLLAGNVLHAEQLRWDKPAQEFHRTPQDKFVETKFTFKNTGATPVTIEDIRTSCGCTETFLVSSEVAPGEAAALEVYFTVGDRAGPQTKDILVLTDDSNEPTRLTLKVALPERPAAPPKKDP